MRGNNSGGYGFYGIFLADPNNGSLVSISIVEHGANYDADPEIVDLCYRGSKYTQVRHRKGSTFVDLEVCSYNLNNFGMTAFVSRHCLFQTLK